MAVTIAVGQPQLAKTIAVSPLLVKVDSVVEVMTAVGRPTLAAMEIAWVLEAVVANVAVAMTAAGLIAVAIMVSVNVLSFGSMDMFKFLMLTVVLSLGAPAMAGSPYDTVTQACILKALVDQYPQLNRISHRFGIIEGDSETFEAQIVQRYDDGGSGNIFVGARDSDYENGYLMVTGLRNQPLNMAGCF